MTQSAHQSNSIATFVRHTRANLAIQLFIAGLAIVSVIWAMLTVPGAIAERNKLDQEIEERQKLSTQLQNSQSALQREVEKLQNVTKNQRDALDHMRAAGVSFQDAKF